MSFPRKRESREPPRLQDRLCWIPACAGMTVGSRFSLLHQRGDMRGGGARQAVKVVAAFEQRDDAAAAASPGDLHQPSRRPGEIRLDQIEMAERVEAMGVEPCRDDDQIGPEIFEARQNRDLERFAKSLT